MKEFKIIFAGSMGAGKTTAIQALSETEVVSTDVGNSNIEENAKLLTTVGIDYGQIFLGEPPDIKVGLYGTPGQKRFELVWRIVSKGALGAIILIDCSTPNSVDELPYYVDYFQQNEVDNIIIGITHADEGKSYLTPDQAGEILAKHNFAFPIYEIDSRKKADVLLLIETLVAALEAQYA